MRKFPYESREGPSRATPTERAIVFVAGAGIPVYLGIRGGAYDLIVREQAGLVLWWILALGFAFGLLPRARPARAARLPLIAFAALVAWTALSLTWTESGEQTFAELARTLDYGGLVVLVLAGVWRGTWRAAAGGLSLAILALPAIAIASRIDPGAFPADEVARAFHGDRLSYPLGYWNAVGAIGAMGIAVGLAWSAHLRAEWLRGLCLAAVPVAASAVFLSYSRTGLAASVLAGVLAVALSRNRLTAAAHALAAVAATGAVVLAIRTQPAIADGTGGAGGWVVGVVLAAAAGACWLVALQTARRRLGATRPGIGNVRPALAIGACTLLIAAIALGPSTASRVTSEFTSGAKPGAASDPAARFIDLGGSRYQIWSSALRAFGSDPIRGIGPGTFQFWWTRDVSGGEQLLDAHSLPIETLAELGLPGFLILVLLFAGLIAFALQARRGLSHSNEIGAWVALIGALAVFVLAAGVDWMWELTAVGVIGIAAVTIAGTSMSASAPRRRRMTRGRLALVVLALLAGVVQVPGIASTDRLRAGEDARRLGLEQRAAELADESIRAEPWAASPYALRATVNASRGRYQDAESDAETAVEREPTNWLYRTLLARVEVQAGDLEAALAAAREARRLHPGKTGGYLEGLEAGLARKLK